MPSIPYSEIKKGTLLIATPEIDSGMFFHSVVLICEHSPNGSFGLVINRLLDFEIPEEMMNLSQLANPNITMRAGGPVQTNQMMLLHNSPAAAMQSLEICPGVYLGGDLKFLQESLGEAGGPHVNLCFGYAGWNIGQLEREFLDGCWFLHPASARHIFETPIEKLWQVLLKEMGGKYAIFSAIPEDLSLN